MLKCYISFCFCSHEILHKLAAVEMKMALHCNCILGLNGNFVGCKCWLVGSWIWNNKKKHTIKGSEAQQHRISSNYLGL